MNDFYAFNELPVGIQVLAGMIAAAGIVLYIFAFRRLWQTPADRLMFGSKLLWFFLILLSQPLGAILFLTVGRRPEQREVETARREAESREVIDMLYNRKPDR